MSPLPCEMFLALRYMRPRRSFVSVITVISTLGVMLGVAVLIVVIAVMSGFDREWRDRILSCNAHLKIFTPDMVMRNQAEILTVVGRNALVKGAAPFVMGQVLVKSQPRQGDALIRGPVLRGVDPELEMRVSALPTNILYGTFDLEGRGLVVGSVIASEMGLRVGDHVAVYSPRNLERMEKTRGQTNAEAILPDDFEVRGIFDVGFHDFNSMMIVSSLENAQDLYGLDGGVHGVLVMLKDPFQAALVQRQFEAALPGNARTSTWMQDNAQIFQALATEKTLMYIILFVVFAIAAFAIVNSEITFAVSKFKDVGLLKALGATNAQVMRTFLGHSMAVGLLGVGLGYGLGRLFLRYINDILHLIRNTTGYDPLPATIYQISNLPYEVLALDVVIICGGAFLSCVIAGLIPAWLAARLDPVEALRHE